MIYLSDLTCSTHLETLGLNEYLLGIFSNFETGGNKPVSAN
jgi:hypothetical protein